MTPESELTGDPAAEADGRRDPAAGNDDRRGTADPADRARSPGTSPGPSPPRHRAFARILRGRFWTSLFGSGFLGGLLVAVAAPLIVSLFQNTGRSLSFQPTLTVVIETRREADVEQGLAPLGPSSGLNALGVAISATVATTGYTGRTLVLECAVFGVSPHAGFHRAEPVTFTATEQPTVTAPCFISLPPASTPRRYNAAVLSVRPQGNGSPIRFTGAPPVTPFTAPPVPAT